MNLRRIVDDRLLELGMERKQLALRMGIDPGTLSRLLNGKQQITQGYANDIAGTLKVPGNLILEAAGFDVGDCRGYAKSLNLHDWLALKYDLADPERVARAVSVTLEILIEADRERAYLRPAIAEGNE